MLFPPTSVFLHLFGLQLVHEHYPYLKLSWLRARARGCCNMLYPYSNLVYSDIKDQFLILICYGYKQYKTRIGPGML